jgi:nitrite reductase/ring-hydroxylating ferredoxin subunit
MFLAHKNDIEQGGYKVIEQLDSRFVLVNDGSLKLVSNVCPHQGSLISQDKGTGRRSCPYHSWSFDLSGNPLTSGRTSHYCINSTPLETKKIFEFNNLIFSNQIYLDQFVKEDISNMILKEHRIDKVNAPYYTIMDLFLDVDHIETVHRGVYNQIGLDNINKVIWEYFDGGSLQIVGSKENPGAAWLAIYPYTMIEWQPGALFVTVSLPKGTMTDVHVFKYSNDEALWPLNESVWETAWLQDKQQAEKIVDSFSKNLEESKIHFRQYMKFNTSSE